MNTTLPDFCYQAAEAALEKKAEKVLILDVRAICDYTRYIMICHGEVPPQIHAIVDAIRDRLDRTLHLHHMEGYETARWVILDYYDFVIHVFDEDTRYYYNLEDLWVDAPHWWFREDGSPLIMLPTGAASNEEHP